MRTQGYNTVMQITDWDKDIRNVLDIELARCKGGYTDELPAKVFMGGWTLQLKLDGIRISMQLGKTRNWLVSRNREDKLKGVAVAGAYCVKDGIEPFASLIHKDLEGTMLDGELVWPGHGAPEVLSLAARSDPKNLKYVVFDVLFYKGQDIREKPYAERLVFLKRAVQDLDHPQIEGIKCLSATQKSLDGLWASGEEGGVFAELKAAYKASCSRYKAKAEQTCDAFVIGMSEGRSGGSPKNGVKPKPNGEVATLTVAMMKSGAVFEVGKMSFPTEEELGQKELELPDLTELWQNKAAYLNRVVEMSGSGWDGKRWRWLRFRRFRNDKGPQDCVFSEQVGEG